MAYGKQTNIHPGVEPWNAAQQSFIAAEERMNKKWGWYTWHSMASPELAQKYQSARRRYLDAIRSREAGVVVDMCSNLVKGLNAIDAEISGNNKPDDVFYLQARINKRNYYFVSDHMDMQRVIPLMKGKDPVVYQLDEIVRIIEAGSVTDADGIKAAFPGATVKNIQFKHNSEQLDDEVPF